jgi:DNA-binding NtrC family response regulator
MEATMDKQVTALLVMPEERHSRLVRCLSGLDANVLTAQSCGEAAQLLRDEPDVCVVLTDLCLPDGSWFDVLNRVGDEHREAKVVVCARVADERLWTQVLEAGGFDVLVEPYQAREVLRIVTAAAAGEHSMAGAARFAAAS